MVDRLISIFKLAEKEISNKNIKPFNIIAKIKKIARENNVSIYNFSVVHCCIVYSQYTFLEDVYIEFSYDGYYDINKIKIFSNERLILELDFEYKEDYFKVSKKWTKLIF